MNLSQVTSEATVKPPVVPKDKKQQNQQKPKQQSKPEGPVKGGRDGPEGSTRDRSDRTAPAKAPVDAAASSARAAGTPKQGNGAQPKGASRLAVFDHLPRKKPLDMDTIESDRLLHPAVVRLGVLYSSGAIYDDDDRVCALYSAFYNVVEDYKTPPNKNLSWDLDKHIRLQVKCLP